MRLRSTVCSLCLLVACAGTPPSPTVSTTASAVDAPPAPATVSDGADESVADERGSEDAVVEGEASTSSAQCPERPGARLVRLVAVDEQPTGEYPAVNVTPITEGAEQGVGLDVDEGAELDSSGTRVAQVLFATRAADGTWIPDCSEPGICRRAIYLRCEDGTHAEVLAPDSYGALIVDDTGRAAEGEGYPILEHRAAVRVSWTWVDGRYERSGEAPRNDPLPAPALSAEDGLVGLPAVSEDGRRVAIVRTTSAGLEGMGAGATELVVLRVRDGREVRVIRVFSHDEDGESTLSAEESRQVAWQANALLARGRFHAMTPLRSLFPDARPMVDASAAGVRLTHRGATVRLTGAVEAEHRPAGVAASPYCCGMEDDSEGAPGCELSPDVTAAWADGATRVVLVSHDVSSMTSGCEGLSQPGAWLVGPASQRDRRGRR